MGRAHQSYVIWIEALFVTCALLLITVSAYLTIKFRFRIFASFPLIFKSLSGSLDRRTSREGLSPAAGVALTVFDAICGSAVAFFFAVLIGGSVVIGWIIGLSVLWMSVQTALIALGRGAVHTQPLSRLSGVAAYLHRFHPAAARLYVLGVLASAILFGTLLPAAAITPFPYGPVWILLAALAAGGAARGGYPRLARFALATAGITLCLFLVLFLVEPRQNLFAQYDAIVAAAAIQAPKPLWHAAGAIWLYFAVSGLLTGRTETIAAVLRVDAPLRAGLAFSIVPLIAILPGLLFAMEFYPTMSEALPAHRVLVRAITVIAFAGSLPGWMIVARRAFAALSGRSPGERLRPAGVFAYLLPALAIATTVLLSSFYVEDPVLSYLALPAFVISLVTGIPALLAVYFAADRIEASWQRLLRAERDLEVTRPGRDVKLLLFHLLPKNLVSRLFGYIALTPWPGFILKPLLRWYAATFHVDLDEAERPLEDYRSLNEFFTRALAPGVRPIAGGARTVVSPVDAVLSQFGNIEHGTLIQAKGLDYALTDLLNESEYTHSFAGGTYCVLYLSPRDYHRIHTPFTGEVAGYDYEPGALFPVNVFSVHSVRDLFPKNERLTTYLETEHGRIAVVKVGATNVGKMSLTYDPAVRTNGWLRLAHRRRYRTEPNEPPRLERGAELGRFEMGSTVVLLFERDCFAFSERITNDMFVQLGEEIGRFV